MSRKNNKPQATPQSQSEIMSNLHDELFTKLFIACEAEKNGFYSFEYKKDDQSEKIIVTKESISDAVTDIIQELPRFWRYRHAINIVNSKCEEHAFNMAREEAAEKVRNGAEYAKICPDYSNRDKLQKLFYIRHSNDKAPSYYGSTLVEGKNASTVYQGIKCLDRNIVTPFMNEQAPGLSYAFNPDSKSNNFYCSLLYNYSHRHKDEFVAKMSATDIKMGMLNDIRAISTKSDAIKCINHNKYVFAALNDYAVCKSKFANCK